MSSDTPSPEGEPAGRVEPADVPPAGMPDLPPATGHPGIDAALNSLILGEDLHTHAEEIGAAVEAIQRALNPPRPQPGVPQPPRR